MGAKVDDGSIYTQHSFIPHSVFISGSFLTFILVFSGRMV